VCVCMYVCMYVCVYICMYVMYVCIFLIMIYLGMLHYKNVILHASLYILVIFSS